MVGGDGFHWIIPFKMVADGKFYVHFIAITVKELLQQHKKQFFPTTMGLKVIPHKIGKAPKLIPGQPKTLSIWPQALIPWHQGVWTRKESSIQAQREPSLRSIPSVQTSGYLNHGLRESSEYKRSGHLEQEVFGRTALIFHTVLGTKFPLFTPWAIRIGIQQCSVSKRLTKPKHSINILRLTFSSLTSFCRDGRNLPETYYLWIITASPLTVACQGLKKKLQTMLLL